MCIICSFSGPEGRQQEHVDVSIMQTQQEHTCKAGLFVHTAHTCTHSEYTQWTLYMDDKSIITLLSGCDGLIQIWYNLFFDKRMKPGWTDRMGCFFENEWLSWDRLLDPWGNSKFHQRFLCLFYNTFLQGREKVNIIAGIHFLSPACSNIHRSVHMCECAWK